MHRTAVAVAPPHAIILLIVRAPPDEATSLERFIALSSLVTGFAVSDLDPSLARLYLASLERWYEGKVDLSDLCTEVGLGDPKLTDTQRQRLVKSLMKRSEHREVLEGVLRYWYSGVYDTADGKACAAFGDALGWRSVRWTFAPGQCHGFGSWSTPPVTPS